ncbi:MAG: DUF177 domain-containing protein [Hyphomicrobiaceae bacterium]|jgi:uncharacterized metal-binding protein YceD (DUF177 family)
MTQDDGLTPVLDWAHDLHTLGERGVQASRSATPEERANLARLLDLAECQRLDVTYNLKPLSRGRIRLKARIEADVVQRCVISLAPVPAHIDETIELEFWPAEDIGDTTVEVDPLGPPTPEPINHGAVDYGRVVYEEIAAALDPYPRAPGAELAPPRPEDEAATKPFAALARLKRPE